MQLLEEDGTETAKLTDTGLEEDGDPVTTATSPCSVINDESNNYGGGDDDGYG